MTGKPDIAVAAHREGHPPLPYVYFDDRSDPMNPGWVLRHEEFGQAVDTALSADNPDDPGEAVAEAAAFLARHRATTITVTRTKVYPRPARRRAWYWSYDCVGPDGRRFDNTSIVTLRQVLRRCYGKGVTVEVQP